MKLKVQNYKTREWEEREPFTRSLLAFIVGTGSQYDFTCRTLAAQVLATQDELADREQELAKEKLEVAKLLRQVNPAKPRRILAGGEPAVVIRDDLDPPYTMLIERADLTRELFSPEFVEDDT